MEREKKKYMIEGGMYYIISPEREGETYIYIVERERGRQTDRQTGRQGEHVL